MYLTTAEKYERNPIVNIKERLEKPVRLKMSKAEEWSQTHYLFNPFRIIDITNEKYGDFRTIERACLVPVNNWTNVQQSLRRYEENSRETLAEYTTYAAWIARSLTGIYAKPQYVVDVEPFIGIKFEYLERVMNMLIPAYPTTTVKLVEAMKQAPILLKTHSHDIKALGQQIGKLDLFDLAEQALKIMIESTLNGFKAQTQRFDTALMERANSEATGKLFYDEDDQELAYLLEREGELIERQPSITDAIGMVAETVRHGQSGSLPTQDIAREQCLGCGELVAVARKKCHYCGEKKAAA